MKRIRFTIILLALAATLGVTSAQAATSISLSETKANRVVTVKKGGGVTLVLHSMFWVLAQQNPMSPLVAQGKPVLTPIMPGPSAPNGCKIAGSGCGTQTWKYKASKIGTAYFFATRTSCGEAMQCTPENGNFKVTVKVVK